MALQKWLYKQSSIENRQQQPVEQLRYAGVCFREAEAPKANKLQQCRYKSTANHTA
jgi:hypothetical protein